MGTTQEKPVKCEHTEIIRYYSMQHGHCKCGRIVPIQDYGLVNHKRRSNISKAG